MTESIRVKNLTKTYTEPTRIVALKDLDLTVQDGEIVGLLGENGAGKTTLVKILATLLLPDVGSVEVGGFDVLRESQQVRKQIGYAGQDSEKSAYWRLTTRQNLVYFAAALRGMKRTEVEDKVESLASRLEFSKKLDREFSSLSGGEKQMVIIMRSLIHNPHVILMDEPSKSLDPVNALLVQEFVRQYVRENGSSLVLTTHNMLEAERLCDRLVFLHSGQITYKGTPSDFRRMVTEDVIILESNLGSFSQELRNLPGVVDLSIRKDTRVATDELVATLPALSKMLARHGLKVHLRVQSPTLEDAYLLLTERADTPTPERVATFE